MVIGHQAAPDEGRDQVAANEKPCDLLLAQVLVALAAAAPIAS